MIPCIRTCLKWPHSGRRIAAWLLNESTGVLQEKMFVSSLYLVPSTADAAFLEKYIWPSCNFCALSITSSRRGKVYLRLRKEQWQTWGGENRLKRTRGDVLPLYHQGGGWTFEGRGWFLRQQKVPLPACNPCCGCLEVSGCGSASPGMCVKGTGKLSQGDGLEQTCTGVGVCRSAFWDTPRPGFLTYQDTPFCILFPHTTTLFVFL